MSLALFFIILWCGTPAYADVVKPALIEITANTNGTVTVEVRTSIEALLSGINAKYKNTKDAPTAQQYDEMRVLPPPELSTKFSPFKNVFIDNVWLKADGAKVKLEFGKIHIPPAGYTKVPRTSVLNLAGNVPPHTKNLSWYYPDKFGDNAVRVRQVDRKNEKWHWSEWQWLRKDMPSKNFSLAALFAKEPLINTIWSYVQTGFAHIYPKGADHILFILGLYLFSTKMRPLLWQVTMFTVAHTITLGLSIYQIITLPPQIVEPLIALSIAYIGFENIFSHRLHTHRLGLVFGFGLLHGLGFAQVLSEFGMPDDAFAISLLSFNVGVELGQLFVVLLAFLTVGLFFSHKPWYRRFVSMPLSALIGLIGFYWALDRMLLL